jgi:hypothetical protein
MIFLCPRSDDRHRQIWCGCIMKPRGVSLPASGDPAFCSVLLLCCGSTCKTSWLVLFSPRQEFQNFCCSFVRRISLSWFVQNWYERQFKTLEFFAGKPAWQCIPSPQCSQEWKSRGASTRGPRAYMCSHSPSRFDDHFKPKCRTPWTQHMASTGRVILKTLHERISSQCVLANLCLWWPSIIMQCDINDHVWAQPMACLRRRDIGESTLVVESSMEHALHFRAM